MAKTYVKIDYGGISEVLKSDGTRAVLNNYAQTVMGRLPAGYDIEQRTTDRAVTVVYAATPEARSDNLKNNSLLKAGGA